MKNVWWFRRNYAEIRKRLKKCVSSQWFESTRDLRITKRTINTKLKFGNKDLKWKDVRTWVNASKSISNARVGGMNFTDRKLDGNWRNRTGNSRKSETTELQQADMTPQDVIRMNFFARWLSIKCVHGKSENRKVTNGGLQPHSKNVR